MKKIRFTFGAILLSTLLALCVLSSCGSHETLEERGYTVKVVYEFNGGIVDETARRVLYYKEGAPLIRPGSSVELKEPLLDRYHVVSGWYAALTDEAGEPLKDETGAFLTEDTPFDFDKERAGENITLVAKWREVPTITIKTEGREDDVRPYTAGESVSRFSYIEGREGYTFYDYFLDEACTEKPVWPLTIDENTHLTLYTRWLEGDVLVVRSRSDLSALSQYKNKTVYLDADIDYADSRTDFPTLTDFSGVFEGNGHVIRNVTKKYTLSKNNKVCGLFGALAEGAVIRDVTFENVVLDVTVSWSAEYALGLVASTAAAGARIENCAFTGCVLTYTRMASASDALLRTGEGRPYAGLLGEAPDDMTLYVKGGVDCRPGEA